MFCVDWGWLANVVHAEGGLYTVAMKSTKLVFMRSSGVGTRFASGVMGLKIFSRGPSCPGTCGRSAKGVESTFIEDAYI